MQLVGLQGVDLFVTYVCNRRICLLEFFIRKKSNEKNGHRQVKRRTCTYKIILGDPGADKGGEGKSKRAEKYIRMVMANLGVSLVYGFFVYLLFVCLPFCHF